MEMTRFFNEFVKDSQVLGIVAIAGGAFLALFSILYNRWMDDLGEKKRGYTALLVVGGNAITLLVVAVISWRAATLVLVAFVISGLAMIFGDIRRENIRREAEIKTINRRSPRRKALPYAAAGLVDDAAMLIGEAQREIKRALDGNSDPAKLGKAGINITEALAKLAEARKTEGE